MPQILLSGLCRQRGRLLAEAELGGIGPLAMQALYGDDHAVRARMAADPLLVYQNYHLIHHLYPEIPFYRMHKAYYLRYDEINAQDIPRQTAFGLAPENIESHRAFRRMKDAIAVPAE
ncbi:hypothetical protein ACFSUK_18010 [Sphingobium scionense]